MEITDFVEIRSRSDYRYFIVMSFHVDYTIT